MARLIPVNVAVGEDPTAAERNRLRVARLRARERPNASGRSYIVGESPSTGRSRAMSDEARRRLGFSTRGMNNKPKADS